jgi:HK97 family phage major capsid protein
MNKRLKKYMEDKAAIVTEMDSILALDTTTPDQDKRFDELKAQAETLQAKIKKENDLMNARETDMPAIKDVNEETVDEKAVRVPAARERVPATAHRLIHEQAKCFKTEDEQKMAYAWGQQMLAHLGNPRAVQYCRDYGYMPQYAVENESVNTQGGYLVFPEIDRSILKLELAYGSFQANARNVPMASDVMIRDRKTGGLTMYAVGESEAITESTMAWDQIQLIARKWGVLTRITNELSADTIIPIMDQLASDVAWASATKKDLVGFLGTGLSTHHGINGIVTKIQSVNMTGTTVDEGGGVIMGTGNAFSELILSDITKLMGLLPDYARANAKFYCHTAIAANVLDLLKAAAGGNTYNDLQTGKMTRNFMGYPVITNNTMASAEATNALILLFGDLSQAADFGTRQGTTMAVSDSAYVGSQSVFERDQLAVRWTERWDINVHDIGTATAAGPVVMLGMKSS